MTIFKTTPDLAVRKTTGSFNAVLTTTSGVGQWDFGDGFVETSNTPSHSYAALPPYLINLTSPTGADAEVITEIDISGQSITAFDLSRFEKLLSVDISNNLIHADDLDLVLLNLDKFGLINGTLDYSTNFSAPDTVEAATAYDNLVSKGWNITGAVPLASFIITVDTTITGNTASDSYEFSLDSGTYDFDVDWGDTNTDTITTGGTFSHTYAVGGIYQITMTARTFIGNYDLNDSADNKKIIEVSQWGRSFQYNSMSQAFRNCENLIVTAIDAPDLSLCSSVERMFQDCKGIMTLDVSKWNTSTISDFGEMFEDSNLISLIGADDLDMSSATRLDFMFQNTDVQSLNLSSWDISNVTTLSGMFNTCDKLANINLSGWNLASVADMSSMFINCTKIVSLDLSTWVPDLVTSVSSMFRGMTSLTSINISTWVLPNCTSIGTLFRSSSALTNLDMSSLAPTGSLNMSFSFNGCVSLTVLDISSLSSTSISTLGNTFESCFSLSNIIGIENLDTSAVADMTQTFRLCGVFDQNISGWDVTSLTNATTMFNSAGLSTANYDALLVGWEAQLVNNAVTFDGGNATYTDPSAASTARAALIADHSWSITDGGVA